MVDNQGQSLSDGGYLNDQKVEDSRWGAGLNKKQGHKKAEDLAARMRTRQDNKNWRFSSS